MFGLELLAIAIGAETTFPNLTYTPEAITGNIYLNILPSSAIKELVLSLFEYEIANDEATYSTPDSYKSEGFKLIYRGLKTDSNQVWKDIKTLYEWLCKKENWTMFGDSSRKVFKIYPMGFAYMGNDSNDYPEYVMRFHVKLIIT